MILEGDTPVAGFYRARIVKNGAEVGIRIWFGQPVVDGEVQDRAPRWCIEVNGETDFIEKDPDHPEYRCRVPLDVTRYWPWCAKNKITQAEYAYLVDHSRWAKENAPHLPDANPRKAIDKRGPSVW